MKTITLLKKQAIASILFAFCLVGSNDTNAQTIVYDVFYGDLINQTNTCSGVPNESLYTQYDANPWGFSWTSTGTGTPISITIEFFRGIDCAASYGAQGELIPITLNGTYETDYVSTSDIGNCDCDAPTPMVESFMGTPANYVSGGVNTIMLPKSVIDNNVEMGLKENPTWGNAYARITVDYCTALTTTVSSNTICEGDLVTLSATSTTGGTITWDNGVVDNVPFMPATTGMTTYTATSDGVGDCSFSVDVLNNPAPIVAVNADTTICLGDSILLVATGNADVYEWNTATPNNTYYEPTSTETVLMTATILATGCTVEESVDLTVNEVIASGVGTDEMLGNDGAIDLTVVGGSTPLTFDWDNDGTGDFDDDEDLTGLTSGTYIVIVQDSIGCTGTTSVTIGSQVGLDADAIAYEVYPNPANDVITIKANGNFEFSVVNVLGQEVLNGNGTSQKMISLDQLESGTYLVMITVNEEVYTTKLVKK